MRKWLLCLLLCGCVTQQPSTLFKMKNWDHLKNYSKIETSVPVFHSVEEVNDYINGYSYIPDSQNYNLSDYWASPDDFFRNGGGDCEDYAISKYFIILQQRLYKQRPRLLLVWDNNRNAGHVVLEVDHHLLDNQSGERNYTILGEIDVR